MCSVKMPKMPATPAPPPVAQAEDPAVAKARDDERRRLAMMRGRASTVMGSLAKPAAGAAQFKTTLGG